MDTITTVYIRMLLLNIGTTGRSVPIRYFDAFDARRQQPQHSCTSRDQTSRSVRAGGREALEMRRRTTLKIDTLHTISS